MMRRLLTILRRPRRTARHVLSAVCDPAGLPRSTEEYRGMALADRWPNAPPHPHASPDPASPLETYFDGVTEGPGVWKWRHYFDIYHRHLQRFVGRRPVVVEIGVYSGGSLAMWHAYFGAGTHVHGVDIAPACRAYADADTTIHIGDQADPAFWETFRRQVPAVDVHIDDGGHAPEQQMASVEAMLPHIRPGGVYICEDVTGTDNTFQQFVGGLADRLHAYAPTSDGTGHVSPTSAFQASIHSLHVYPFVVVIEKRAGPMPSFSAPRHGTQWQPHL
ncbi:MAG: class I SAM-dependent methyltransferase [Planctomycetia bacterium]